MSIFALLSLLFFILTIVGLWKMFEKAAYPGWIILIPFYNFYIWLKIIKKPLMRKNDEGRVIRAKKK